MKRFLFALALALAPIAALAQDTNVSPTQLTTVSSGNVANASAVATLAAKPGMLNRLCGFQITSTGATGAAVVSPSVTGLAGGTATYTYAAVAGATLSNVPLTVQFVPCAPASAPNTAIVVTLPALGAGNTNATVSAQGYSSPWP